MTQGRQSFLWAHSTVPLVRSVGERAFGPITCNAVFMGKCLFWCSRTSRELFQHNSCLHFIVLARFSNYTIKITGELTHPHRSRPPQFYSCESLVYSC